MKTIDLDRLTLADGHHILDLGCGRGRHMHAVYYHRRCHAIGLDLSLEDIETTRAGFAEAPDLEPQIGRPRHYALTVGDATQLPFDDHHFDRLICSEVLEHIPDFEAAVAEIWRVTKPGGRIGLSVPRAWPEKICWWLSDEYHNQPGGHVRIFNFRDLRAATEKTGFRFVGHHHAHGLHSPYWWLKCWVGVDRDTHPLVKIYHRLLVLEILKNPFWLRAISKIADPLMGKSTVLYFDKPLTDAHKTPTSKKETA